MIRLAGLGALAVALGLGTGCGQSGPTQAAISQARTQGETRSDDMQPGQTGVVKTELRTGTGPAIAAGQTAVVQYTGWLYATGAIDHKGRKFDSSRDHGEPFEFRVGAGDVIAGWDQGVAGMQAGGERRLVIPPELGYGSRGAGGVIPPGATLVFDVELVGIR